MRRDYGSELFSLVDAPMNRETILRIYAATAGALAKWEPRFVVRKVEASSAAPGTITLELTGVYLPDGRTITLSGIKV